MGQVFQFIKKQNNYFVWPAVTNSEICMFRLDQYFIQRERERGQSNDLISDRPCPSMTRWWYKLKYFIHSVQISLDWLLNHYFWLKTLSHNWYSNFQKGNEHIIINGLGLLKHLVQLALEFIFYDANENPLTMRSAEDQILDRRENMRIPECRLAPHPLSIDYRYHLKFAYFCCIYSHLQIK